MMENGRNSHSQMEDLAETVGALLSFMFQYQLSSAVCFPEELTFDLAI